MPTPTIERHAEAIRLTMEVFAYVVPCDWKVGHENTGVPCSGEATHLTWMTCEPEVKWRSCLRAASWMLGMMHHDCRIVHSCVRCHLLIRDCWKVVPI